MKMITITSIFALIPGLAWAAPNLAVDGECGGSATISVHGLTGSDSFYVMWGDSAGSDEVPYGSCAGTVTELDGLHVYGSAGSADSSGISEFVWRIYPGFCGRSMQVIDRASCEVSNRVTLPSSSLAGATCDYSVQYWDGGRCVNIATSYNAGYGVGETDGYSDGYLEGYGSVDATYEEGYDAMYAIGFADGEASVSLEGYELAGFEDGYEDGLMEGDWLGRTEGTTIGFYAGSDDFYCEGDEPDDDDDGGPGVRLRIQYQGYAVWTQDVATMSDMDQDMAMHAACDSNFPGSSPLSLTELVEGRTRDMPVLNDSGYNVVPACGADDHCIGDADGAAVDGHDRQCVTAGWAFPEKIFPPSYLWDSSCGSGGITDQAAVCVTYEEVEGALVVAEGRHGNYGQDLWILDVYTGDVEEIGPMSDVPVTGLSYDLSGNLWYVEAKGWDGAPDIGIMDPFTGDQDFMFVSGETGAHSGFTWTDDTLYIWSEDGDSLYEIDDGDGSASGPYVYGGSYDNGICTDYEGNMYRTTGYDTFAIAADGMSETWICGSTMWPGTAGGDCTFHEGEMYLLAGDGSYTDRSLWHINLSTCEQTDLGIPLPDGADALAGLP